MKTLERAYYQSAAANALRLAELERILAEFGAVQAPVLVLKGAAFGEELYGNIALRPMADLDLVTDQRHVPACQAALAQLGYHPIAIEENPGFDLAYRSQQGFRNPDPTSGYIELHWHLVEIPYYLQNLPMDWFWANCTTIGFGKQKAQVLNPIANLLYLSAHLALHHRFDGLRWFVDLALLIDHNRESIDWAQVVDVAQRFELVVVLRETLDRLVTLWPRLPLEEPLALLAKIEPSSLERRLFRLLTAEPRSPLLDFVGDLASLPARTERLRFLLLNVFPQPAYMQRRYEIQKIWHLPYWYLHRQADGLVKLARTIPQAIRVQRDDGPTSQPNQQ
jgi:hypothetical protein